MRYVFFTEVEATIGAPVKGYFDNSKNPVGPEPAAKAEPVRPQATRRRYSHTFSSGRRLKLVLGANGQERWRVVPDAAIVHYGKQFTSKKKQTDLGNFQG